MDESGFVKWIMVSPGVRKVLDERALIGWDDNRER